MHMHMYIVYVYAYKCVYMCLGAEELSILSGSARIVCYILLDNKGEAYWEVQGYMAMEVQVG